MHTYVLTTVLLIAVVVSSHAKAQQEFAVPSSVKKVAQASYPAGRLVVMRGYLEQVGKEVVLRDITSGQKLDLDSSRSAVSLEYLIDSAGSTVVEVTARTTATTKNGRRSVVVLGALPLTP